MHLDQKPISIVTRRNVRTSSSLIQKKNAHQLGNVVISILDIKNATDNAPLTLIGIGRNDSFGKRKNQVQKNHIK